MTTLERPRWLHVKEVADLLGLHEITVRRKIARGEIPGVLQLGGPGSAIRVLEEELERWLFRSSPADGSRQRGSFTGMDPAERRGTQRLGESSPPAHAGREGES